VLPAASGLNVYTYSHFGSLTIYEPSGVVVGNKTGLAANTNGQFSISYALERSNCE
jgi:hypothetical protein